MLSEAVPIYNIQEQSLDPFFKRNLSGFVFRFPSKQLYFAAHLKHKCHRPLSQFIILFMPQTVLWSTWIFNSPIALDEVFSWGGSLGAPGVSATFYWRPELLISLESCY